jgi:hypothetical protein
MAPAMLHHIALRFTCLDSASSAADATCEQVVPSGEKVLRRLVDSHLPRFQWEYEPEHGADAVWLFAGEIPSVCPRIAARDRQPETRAARLSCPTMIKSY